MTTTSRAHELSTSVRGLGEVNRIDRDNGRFVVDIYTGQGRWNRRSSRERCSSTAAKPKPEGFGIIIDGVENKLPRLEAATRWASSWTEVG